MTYTETDLKDLERVCYNLTHENRYRRMDGEMGRRLLVRKFGPDTLAEMFIALQATPTPVSRKAP